MTPILTTERLTLRRPAPQDLDAFTAFYATERSIPNGGPLDAPAAWRAFAAELGHWEMRGFGMCSVLETGTGRLVGRVGLWYPGGWPEPEMGWTLYDGAEGKGYATEAAFAMRAHAARHWGRDHLISIILPDNARSIAVARRLGATHEREWTSPTGRQGQIWRHMKEAA